MTASSGTGGSAPQWHRDLLAREPIFDHPEFIWDDETFEIEIAPDFREIGASGAQYEREDIKRVVLGRLKGTHPVSLVGGYRIEDAQVVELTDALAQVRYTLHGQGRITAEARCTGGKDEPGKRSSTKAPSSRAPTPCRPTSQSPTTDDQAPPYDAAPTGAFARQDPQGPGCR